MSEIQKDVQRSNIIEAITERAENERNKAIEVADAYAQSRAEEAISAIRSISKDSEDETKAIAEDIRKKAEVSLRMEKNRVVLDAKRRSVGRIYEILREKLKGASAEDFLRLVSSCLASYGEKGQVMRLSANSPVNVGDVEVLEEVKKLGIKVESAKDVKSGFVLSGDCYDRDFSVESIVESLKEKTERECSDRLFGLGEEL